MPLASCSERVAWSMFVAAHRAQLPRRSAHGHADRVLVFAPDADVRRWVEHEVFGEHLSIEIAEALADIVTRLTLVPPPWPQFLIVDADAILADEADLLAAIRDAGWPGFVIAIGEASQAVRRSLETDAVLPRPLDCEQLRNTLKKLASRRVTTPRRRLAR